MRIERSGAWSALRRHVIFIVLFVAWPVLAVAQSLELLHHFSGHAFSDGPKAALLAAVDGQLYGTTVGGGIYNKGSIFRMTPAGDVTLLHSFAGGTDGYGPVAALIQAFDGRFYGTTQFGGTFNLGTAFRMEPDGAVTILHSFGGSGECATPTVLLQATDGNFYGVAPYARSDSFIAAIFKMTADGTVTIVYGTPVFPGTLGVPVGLIQASDGNFIGTTAPRVVGGPYDWGTVFRLTPDGTLTVLHAFTIGAGNVYWPGTGVIEASDGNFYGTTDSGGIHDQGTVFRMTSAGDVTLLHSFTGGADGSRPRGSLFEADGSIYGTTAEGLNGFEDGAVFKISPEGLFTLLHTFSGAPDGSHPYGGVVQTTDGTLYGTTQKGGAADFGTVFTVDGTGAVSLIHQFGGGLEGAAADSPLVPAVDGHLYGATCAGGLNNRGTLFRSTRAGAFTVLYTFLGTVDGSCPQGLVQASDGLLYGTTSSAGVFGGGTLFRWTPGGMPIVLHAFGQGIEGRSPRWLIQASDGHLYGTTLVGGAANRGTVFRMTLSGDFTVVREFAGGTADGAFPGARLLQASDGQFYGTTSSGGAFNRGTIFRMTSSGTLTLLHSFSGSASSGNAPAGPLVEGAAGILYGATSYVVFVTPNTSYFCVLFFQVSPAGGFGVLPGTGSRCGGGFGIPLSYWLVKRQNGALLGVETTTGSSIVSFPLDGPVALVRSLGPGEGSEVAAPLIEAGGNLYGLAKSGGVYGGGTIFRLRYMPDTPGLLTVSPVGTHVRLAWTPSAGATSYTIKRSTTPGTETTIASGLVGTEFVDTTADRGQTYHYRVTAANSFGESTATYEVSITPGRAVAGDFDGDSKTDIAVFRPSTGTWYIRQSSNASLAAITWGQSTDILVPGDYDGDGRIDAAVFRPSTGVWYIRPSTTLTMMAIPWGAGTDIPVPGDYDGDGRTDAAVFRPSTGTWYIRQSRTFTLLTLLWGVSTDAPVPGDYDGDGQTDVAVFRPSTSTWYVRRTSTLTMATFEWGGDADRLVPADYDGDGKADVSVFRPLANAWYILQSGPAMGATMLWGDATDVPVPGDYDGDGRSDLAAFRPSTGVWYIRLSMTAEMLSGPWGDPTDVPIFARP